MTARRRAKAPISPSHEVYAIKELEQVKVLADPLRIRMLEAFAEERTTKQVADVLGEKPTKLYHHVEAMERVGLISPTRTRQNRGTVEKYYLAVARAFRADSRVFQPTGKKDSAANASVRQMLSMILDQTAAELNALQECGADDQRGAKEEAIVSFLELRAPPRDVDRLRKKIQTMIASVTAPAEGHDDAKAERGQRYRLTLAFYPLDSGKPAPRRK